MALTDRGTRRSAATLSSTESAVELALIGGGLGAVAVPLVLIRWLPKSRADQVPSRRNAVIFELMLRRPPPWVGGGEGGGESFEAVLNRPRIA